METALKIGLFSFAIGIFVQMIIALIVIEIEDNKDSLKGLYNVLIYTEGVLGVILAVDALMCVVIGFIIMFKHIFLEGV